MKNYKFIILIIFLAFALPYTYGGCVVVYSSGDLNRDNDQNTDETTVDFTGITSQAAITPLNAESLTTGAFAGGQSSAGPESLKLSQSSNAARIDLFRPLRFPLVLGDSLRGIELGAALSIPGRTNVITESDNLEGSCGGALSYTLTLDKISGEFSGNFLFADYCEDGMIISGETDIDGTFEVNSGVFDTATFSFDDLSDDSHTLDGEISMDFTDTPVTATFTAYSTDKQTGRIYWLKNYSINLSELIGHVEIEIFGTFYHPDNGFVTLTTPEPFVVFDEDVWPASGQLVIQGDGATKARLTSIDPLQCRIEADTDGDGIFDWNSGILNWTDLRFT
jgi:hypothetical protein